MRSIKRVTVVGIGGVGGYYGGKLVRYYRQARDVEITFIARGEHASRIRSEGLRLTGNEEFTVHPHQISERPLNNAVADLVVFCTKNYDLMESARMFKGSIGASTIVLPLLNGVEASSRLKEMFPEAIVLEGCVYIVSRIEAPGMIKESGTFNKVLLGPRNDAGTAVEALFKNAGIDVTCTDNILQAIWEKFLFVCPIATLTSAYDKPIGYLLATPQYKMELDTLMQEMIAVAGSKGVNMPASVIRSNLEKMAALPYETTSSMHLDIVRGKKSEIDTFTGYIVRAAKHAGISVPLHERLLAKLAGIAK